MGHDYEPIPKLDKYHMNDEDFIDYNPLSPETRQKAERAMDLRDKQANIHQLYLKGKIAHGGPIFDDQSITSMINNDARIESELKKSRDRNYRQIIQADDDEDDDDDPDLFTRIDDMKGNLASWIKDPSTVSYIRKIFRRFLRTYSDKRGTLVYERRLNEMCSNNLQSMEVDYNHLTNNCPILAYWLFESPTILLPYLNQLVHAMACKLFPNYTTVHSEIFLKIRNFPLQENIRDLQVTHLNSTVKINGLVTRRYPVTCQLKKIYYICRCGDRKGPIYQIETEVSYLGHCHNCKSKGPYFLDKENLEYRNHQRLVVQEIPSMVPPGRVARQKTVILLGDNIDSVRPGDQVEITGSYLSRFDYNMTSRHGFPIFSTLLEANNISRLNEIPQNDSYTENFHQIKITKLSKRPDVAEIIFNSIAPNIHGHPLIKKAVALALFGGVPVERDTHRIRGDINILLVGDAGMGKSQVLKFVQNVIPRTIYTTGKGASAVGLTASVRRDNVSGEWVLEGGALVLADNGFCLIDEFDKMNENDRTSIHEAMEQQTISISKAGIVANLKARCSIIASANPINGKYKKLNSFKQNVNLSDPIISRFDLICVLKDESNPALDQEIAEFILKTHSKARPVNEFHKVNETVQEKIERKKEDGFDESEEMSNSKPDRGGVLGRSMIKEEDDTSKELGQSRSKNTSEKVEFTNKDSGSETVSRKSKTNNSESTFSKSFERFKVHNNRISPEFLKMYVAYARKNFRPKIKEKHKSRIEKFYQMLRKESTTSEGTTIVIRHLESLIRLCMASAKMHLRNMVSHDDVTLAISVILESFIQSQKASAQKILRKRFREYLYDHKNMHALLRQTLDKLFHHKKSIRMAMGASVGIPENLFQVTIQEFRSEASKKGITNVNQFVKSKMFKKYFKLRGDTIFYK
jgi:DNA replication licensing factor MCM2